MSNAVTIATIAIIINSVSLALVIGKVRRVERAIKRQEIRTIKARINGGHKGGRIDINDYDVNSPYPPQ